MQLIVLFSLRKKATGLRWWICFFFRQRYGTVVNGGRSTSKTIPHSPLSE
jgi:hypothetical protein